MLDLRPIPVSSPFPTCAQLRQGTILGTTVRAVGDLSSDSFHDYYRWAGHVLEVTDYNETHGCIAFRGTQIVGVFFDAESERSPFGDEPASGYDAMSYFRTAPPEVQEIAREDVLPRMLDWVGGTRALREAIQQGVDDQLPASGFAAVITAAFWSEGSLMTADEPWSSVYFHGAHLLRLELSESESALEQWAADLELSPLQTSLIRQLFRRRETVAKLPLMLSESELAQFRAVGTNHLAWVSGLLAAVDIIVPDRF